MRELMEKILPEKTEIEGFRVEHKFDKIGKRIMLVNAKRLEMAPELPQMILIALDDVTRESSGGSCD